MFGNLIRECGVLNKLSLSAQNELASLVTILLGISIASTMTADRFVRLDTLMIIGLGLLAFIFDTFGGVMFAKLINMFRPEGKKYIAWARKKTSSTTCSCTLSVPMLVDRSVR
jgi:oxaloacetate decarboxylase beta subunit